MGASCSSTPEEINKKNNYRAKDNNNESKNSPSKGYKASNGNNDKV